MSPKKVIVTRVLPCLFVALCVFKHTLLGFCLAGSGTDEPRHLKDARLLMTDLSPKNTSYRHKDGEVVWKGENGAKANICHTDCSGFIDALLEHSYGYSEADLKKWFDSKRPTARRYVEQIKDKNGFEEIKSLKNLKPGDIIAIKYPEGDKNTGHVMLAASIATPRDATKPIHKGTKQWEVTVIDTSTSGHGPNDTRRTEGGEYYPGLGRGILRLYIDQSGAVAGYSWSTFGNSDYHLQEERPLRIGRLVPGFKPN